MVKKWLSALLALGLVFSGCSSAAPEPEPEPEPVETQAEPEEKEETGTPDERFVKMLDELVVDLCEENYMVAHQYFVHPENYGVDISKCKITLGTIMTTDEDRERVDKYLDMVEAFKDEEISEDNRKIADELIWEFTIQKDEMDPQFDYLPGIWSSNHGVQTQLVQLFTEYSLYSEDDIKPLIELIDDSKRYADEAIDYSKKQAERHMLRMDYEKVIEQLDEYLEKKNDSIVQRDLNEEIDTLGLDENTAKTYKQEISNALNTSLYPALETMKKGLEDLEDSISEPEGLATYRNGDEYYKLLLKDATGSDTDIKEITDNIYELVNDSSAQYRSMLKNDKDLASKTGPLNTKFKKISEILPFLENNYTVDFPKVEEMEYELKPLASEQSVEGVMAYFLIPPIDSTKPYEMRYNAKDYGDDPDSLQLYNTLAHEGVPGHMYQTQFNREHFTHPIEFMIGSLAFTEGYATYAAYEAEDWLGLNADELQINKLVEQYSQYMTLLMDLQVNGQGFTRDEFTDTWGSALGPAYDQLAEDPAIFFNYYYGFAQISALKSRAEAAKKDKFDPVAFNQVLLENGNLNFDLISKQIDKWLEQ